MDAEEIFRQLSMGAVFERGKNKDPDVKNTSGSANERTKTETAERKLKENQAKDKTHAGHITLLGNITSVAEPPKKRKKTKGKDPAEINEINRLRNVHQISVNGEVPSPIESFDELATRYNVSQRLINNVKNCGFEKPTPIQMQAIPTMLEGKQILACAPTGSGKTVAFLIPVIHSLRQPKNGGFRAVIVSPTRELSLQTYRECVRLCEGTQLRVHFTVKINELEEKFKASKSKISDILISTPNRLVYLLDQEPSILTLEKVEWLIVDESDKLFETGVRGFREQLAVIYRACDSIKLKRAMFSATHTVEVAKWCRKNLGNLALVNVGRRNTVGEDIEQELIYVGNEDGKLIGVRDIIRKGVTPPVLIFLQSKERARDLFYELVYDGINVDVIHADRTQVQRDKSVKAFREGKIWVLICTELMGRGIDFKGVNLVINYDFPTNGVSYIHRIGRTGRAGRKGKAVTFFTDSDIPYLKSVVNVMKESGCNLPDFLLSLKRPKKSRRKRLENSAPTRDPIIMKPHLYKKSKKSTKEGDKNEIKSKKIGKSKYNKERLTM